MRQFRELMRVALLSGTLAGLALFAVQRFTVIPLIQEAERYENAAAAHQPAEHHEHEAWTPGEGWERTVWTAGATVLMGIGFSALLFGFLELAGAPLTPRRGALWGMAAFACIHLAPALGLPPLPPGSAAADLGERQLWSAATIAATAIGLWLLAGRGHAWPLRIAGAALILAPHLSGAPTPVGRNLAPPQLMRRFATASLATTCLFWLLAGAIGGWIRQRTPADR